MISISFEFFRLFLIYIYLLPYYSSGIWEQSKPSISTEFKNDKNIASAKIVNSNLEAKTKAKKSFISFKKPVEVSNQNSQKTALLDKLKFKNKIRPSTKKQKLLEEAAVKNKNSILKYVLPRTPRADIDRHQDSNIHKVEKEAESLKACSSENHLT